MCTVVACVLCWRLVSMTKSGCRLEHRPYPSGKLGLERGGGGASGLRLQPSVLFPLVDLLLSLPLAPPLPGPTSVLSSAYCLSAAPSLTYPTMMISLVGPLMPCERKRLGVRSYNLAARLEERGCHISLHYLWRTVMWTQSSKHGCGNKASTWS